ncbi:MAG: putative toxin-antitoxin system toxin component, PIN family [Saprospiraceae bacterium]
MSTIVVRAVLDTNILIAIIGKKSPFRWIFDCIVEGKIVLAVSNEILLEYREVLEEKNGTEVAENVTNLITVHPLTERIEIYYNFHLIKEDEDDNKYVDCAVTANAVCIVSNDTHFQILKKIPFPKVTILTLQEFEDQYRTLLTT